LSGGVAAVVDAVVENDDGASPAVKSEGGKEGGKEGGREGG